MSALAFTGSAFLREHLRMRLVLVLLVVIPAVFVWAVAGMLSEFADALGGQVPASSTNALGAGWSAAFLAGSIAFFQVASSREADRRLAQAGFGSLKTAVARMSASLVLAVVVSVAAFAVLWIRAGVESPAETFAAILFFSLVYLGIGTLVGSFIAGQLEGSVAVAMVFIIDIFAGPGMADLSGPAQFMPTRYAAEVLMTASGGQSASGSDWLYAGLAVALALVLASLTFFISARARS